jgi:hypothetical protein
VTNDSASLQRAVDTAARRRETLVLPARHTYLLTRSLELPSHSVIVGHGASTVLRFSWSVKFPGRDGTLIGNVHQDGADHDIVLDDFAVQGAGSGLPSGPNSTRPAPFVPGIRLRDVDGFRITRLDIGYVAGISVLYQNSGNGLIAGNHVHNSGRDGITGMWRDGGSAGPVGNVVVRDNVISDVGDDGIAVVGPDHRDGTTRPSNVVIERNRILGWRRDPNGLQLGRGIALLAVNNVIVRNNYVRRTVSSGLLVAGSARPGDLARLTGDTWGSSQVLLAGNTVIDAGADRSNNRNTDFGGIGAAIVAEDSDHVTLRSNVLVRPAQGRVVFSQCQACG